MLANRLDTRGFVFAVDLAFSFRVVRPDPHDVRHRAQDFDGAPRTGLDLLRGQPTDSALDEEPRHMSPPGDVKAVTLSRAIRALLLDPRSRNDRDPGSREPV